MIRLDTRTESCAAMIRVAVIGAGAAGLCVARYMVSQPEMFSPVVFEQTGSIGGTWVYTEETGNDSNGIPIHSSMYYNLRTNFCKQAMAFPDFPFPPELKSYVHRSDVLQYLESYSSHFGVDEVVQLNTLVTRVHPIKQGGGGKVIWEVTVRKVDEQESRTSQFDAVVVCNGHFSTPSMPDVPGLNSFRGIVMHSHDYRHAEVFQDMDVVVLGGGFSGVDISLNLTDNAHKIYFSHRNQMFQRAKFPSNIEQVPPIQRVTDDGMVQFTDGQTRRADAILLCTGYKYSFPFLSPECHVTIDLQGKRINTLYKDVFHSEYPSLSFVGIPTHVLPFQVFAIQARCVVAVLSGKAHLPSPDEMEVDTAREREMLELLGWPAQNAHRRGVMRRSYCASLAKLAGCPTLDIVLDEYQDYAYAALTHNVINYKDLEIYIKDSNTFFVVQK